MKRLVGFTLIEFILTIIVVGLVSLAASNTLQLGFQSYHDSLDRQDNQMQAKFVIEKLSRELRHAIPNSVNVSTDHQCVSFIPIESSAFYLSLPLAGEEMMDVVVLSDAFTWNRGLRLVINPSSQEDLLKESNRRFVNVTDVIVSGGVSSVSFSTVHTPPFISSSVSERAFFYYPESIEYCIIGDGIYRSNTQLISHVSQGEFGFKHASIHQNSMINVMIAFRNELGEITQYQHDVQVINVP